MTLPPPAVETVDGLRIVRDDLLPGGTKVRALAPYVADSPSVEFVYAGPAYGYAQVALALVASRADRRATVFVPARKALHPRSREALDAGARVVEVRYGRLTVLAARARAYVDATDAELVPFGLDADPFLDAIADAARLLDPPDEVWCAAGSGVLSRSLQRAWPDADHHAVVVGGSPNVGRARRWDAPEPFERPAEIPPPFPSTSHYDAKVWRFAVEHATPGALLWNVAP